MKENQGFAFDFYFVEVFFIISPIDTSEAYFTYMTFLNPIFLLGLFSAAIPILLHLLNLRKLKTVEFSTLRFLKDIQRSTIRRVRIRQWLLLLLRTLLIVFLVFAFSRPAIRGSIVSTIGTSARTTMVFLVDDSPSMSVRNEGGEVFGQVKESAKKMARLMKDGDEAYVLPLSEIRHREAFEMTRSPADLQKALADCALSAERVTYRDALNAAAKVLSTSKNLNQELFLFTDAQASQFAVSSKPEDSSSLFSDRVKLFLMSAGKNEDNRGIASITPKTKIIVEGKPVRLDVNVANAGETPVQEGLLSVFLSGTRVVQKTIDIPPEAETISDVSVLPQKRGYLHGSVETDEDKFEGDNRRFFVLHVPSQIRVLIVGARKNTSLIRLSLSAENDSTQKSLMDTKVITEEILSATELGKYEVVILSGVGTFSQTDSDRLEQFVRTGGAIMLFPGEERSIDNYNASLLKATGIPPITASATTAQGDHLSFLSFGQVDYDHPLFEGLFEQPVRGGQSRKFDSPKILRKINIPSTSHGRSIIRLVDGSEFLTEYLHGEGRILLCAVAANLDWSDLPVKGIFLPLIYRGCIYLSAAEGSIQSSIVGQEISIQARVTNTGAGFVLRSPSGIEERIVPRFSALTGVATFVSVPTTEAGIYELVSLEDGTILQAVAVNIAPEESEIRVATGEEESALWKRVGLDTERVTRIAPEQNIEQRLAEARFGTELWKVFVFLALLCAVIEMIVGRAAKHQETEVSA